MTIADLGEEGLNEFASLMLGDLIGEGMSRRVYQHAFDESKVVKVENSERHFQNVIEWEIWNQFNYCKDVYKWLAPCHAISYNGTFLIMDKAVDLQPSKKIIKLPGFLSDHKRENFGMIGNRIVARDYGKSLFTVDDKLRKWQGD